MAFVDETGHYYTPASGESGMYPAASDTLSEVGEYLIEIVFTPPEAPTPIPRIGPDRRAGN